MCAVECAQAIDQSQAQLREPLPYLGATIYFVSCHTREVRRLFFAGSGLGHRANMLKHGKDSNRRGPIGSGGRTASLLGNNAGIAHENGPIEGPHSHLNRTIGDAVRMRKSCDFADLTARRRFVDEIVSRRNGPNDKRIDID